MGLSPTGTVCLPRTRTALRIRRVNGLPPLETLAPRLASTDLTAPNRLQACFCWVLPPLSGERGVPTACLVAKLNNCPDADIHAGHTPPHLLGVHRDWLLDDEVVLDALYTGNGRSVFACCGLLIRSIHEAAELNDSLDCLDTDRK